MHIFPAQISDEFCVSSTSAACWHPPVTDLDQPDQRSDRAPGLQSQAPFRPVELTLAGPEPRRVSGDFSIALGFYSTGSLRVRAPNSGAHSNYWNAGGNATKEKTGLCLHLANIFVIAPSSTLICRSGSH